MTVPCHKNVSSRGIGKKRKCRDLEIEVQRMWKRKSDILPISINPIGTTKNEWRVASEMFE